MISTNMEQHAVIQLYKKKIYFLPQFNNINS